MRAKGETKMGKNDLIGMLGKVLLIVGLPAIVTAIPLYQDKQKQKIIKNPVGIIECIAERGDGIDKLLRKYGNLPDSVDPRDVREYTKEINGKKTSDLYLGETIRIPVYKIDKERK